MPREDEKSRILLVEDNPGDALLIKAIFQDAPQPGFDLVWMKSLSSALQALEQHPVDAVLLDLGLPDAQGMETLHRVNGQGRSIPIVVLTGQEDERIALAAIQAGAQDYLAKGELSPPLLFRTLRYAMDRHQRELALRHQEALFRILANSAPMLLWLSDEQDQVAFFNHTWLQFTGRMLVEECGKGWLNGVHPHDRSTFLNALAEAKARRKTFEIELRLRRLDGEYRWILLTCAPRITDDGAFLGYIGSGVDLTEHRRTEEALRQAQKLEGLGLLAGGIAHDFNNLLATIMGNAELARATAEACPEVHPYLDAIDTATYRASGLTRQMLAYAGKGIIKVERLDLNPVVREIGDLLHVAMSKKIDLTFDLEEGLPDLEGDVPQIQQVVMNLVTNASDAIGDTEGRIRIRTSKVHLGDGEVKAFRNQSLDAGSYVLLEVEDSGVGMSPEVLERIFDPFYTTKVTGRGLGMSAVLGILTGHGAGYHIESAPGRGTRFQVFFPALKSHEVSPPRDTTGDWQGRGVALVVDDEPEVLAVNAALMETFGFEVLLASDGQEALDQFDRNRDRITFVLTDMSMPRLNGMEAARAILQRAPGMPIVLCSGYPPEVYALETLPLAGFLQKPFRRSDLAHTLQGIFKTGT